MAAKPETAIVNKIQKWIKKQGGECYHVHGSMFQRKGEPDLSGEIVYKGLVFHLKLEVKTAIGKADPIQIHFLKHYHKWDYVAGVVRSVEDVERLLDAHWRYQTIKPMTMTFGQAWKLMGYEDSEGIYAD
jgi:hypothetical protein